jgi:hypothetical protein
VSPSFGLVGLAFGTGTAGNGRACARQEAAAVYQQPVSAPTAVFLGGRYHRPVRRLLTWLVVTLGVAALIRRLRRRSRDQEAASDAGSGAAAETDAEDDPADELRRKLAETRVEDEPESSVPTVSTVEERRAEIHGQGRAALDEMNEPGER